MRSQLLWLMFALGIVVGSGCSTAPPSNDAPRDLGIAWSPRGWTENTTEADGIAFYEEFTDFGALVAYHIGWRDSVETAGQLTQAALSAQAAREQFAVVPAVGFGWDIAQVPDLTSESEPSNNDWSNAETRDEFKAMVTAYAEQYQPAFLFLGNETNFYYRDYDASQWQSWVSELADCYDAIKSVSPDTLVFTGFQYELLVGGGVNNGWNTPAQWEVLDTVAPHVDAIGFTTYPYFDYDAPAEIPDDYYTQITDHYDGPVVFTEVGWPAVAEGPYPGSEADQAAFVDRFFELTDSLDVVYTIWPFLHDVDPAAVSFASIGLRTNDGTSRPAEQSWKDVVASRK